MRDTADPRTAACKLVGELVGQMNQWYGKVTYDYQEFMKKLNGSASTNQAARQG
jgi:hypothetical protein